ncbi:uncharacterized protein BCR38DRAFT_434661 [Pseudomassariella vexata]|uniref:Proteinase inhibitor, propeptide n=1 Tax=Pseudomassariella vexata TaxID=1141098 RepID=A0A1Y2DYA7_9PEZI|nr:uncharacterized protein BCR38DRAFT_434661 [Pseudomassariella vexata]ORY64288.1 hypothetical protein BCR38DRAFT_434661 [Pseudomassariella vexata]
MRFFTTVVAVLAAAHGAFAVDIQKDIIITFPSGTADDIVNRAMVDIRKAGGMITHEYQLIKAFAAKAPQKVVESVTAWSAEYNAVIEEDNMVKISNDIS